MSVSVRTPSPWFSYPVQIRRDEWRTTFIHALKPVAARGKNRRRMQRQQQQQLSSTSSSMTSNVFQCSFFIPSNTHLFVQSEKVFFAFFSPKEGSSDSVAGESPFCQADGTPTIEPKKRHAHWLLSQGSYYDRVVWKIEWVEAFFKPVSFICGSERTTERTFMRFSKNEESRFRQKLVEPIFLVTNESQEMETSASGENRTRNEALKSNYFQRFAFERWILAEIFFPKHF